MNGSSKASNEMGQEFLDEDEYDIDLEELKKMKLRKRISYWYLQVAVVVFYCLYVFTAVYVCVEPIFGSYMNKYALISLGVLAFLVLFSVISYARAYLTSPGHVTRIKGSIEPEKLDTRRYNYCAICELYKPPRCHHCRRCNKCVLRMDHHCLWINNCVGMHNHKFFYLFIVYAWLAFVAVFALYVGRWLVYVRGIHEPELKFYQVILLGFATFFDLGHILTVGWMVYFQTYLISHNRTNVEHACCEGRQEGCDFDTNSVLQNWSSVFGSRVYDWWIPIAPPYEGGRKIAEGREYKAMKDVEDRYDNEDS